MNSAMQTYVKYVDRFNYVIGRIVMYGIFAMVAILAWSISTKIRILELNPSLWTLEMAQFAMVAYYILGGPYSIQLKANIRMDLFYHKWPDRKKAWFDAFTILFRCSIWGFCSMARSTAQSTPMSISSAPQAPGGPTSGRSKR